MESSIAVRVSGLWRCVISITAVTEDGPLKLYAHAARSELRITRLTLQSFDFLKDFFTAEDAKSAEEKT